MQRPLQRLLQAQRPQPLSTRPLQLLQACMKQPRPKPQRQELHAWAQPLQGLQPVDLLGAPRVQRPLRRLALQAQRPQPRPLQLLQACMKQPRPKLQMQELQISWAQPHMGLQPLHLQLRPWRLMALQAKGSQPLIRGGAVGLEIAISSRRADEIGDDVSRSANILQTPTHPG